MNFPDGDKPSLDNARARIARSGEHLKALEIALGNLESNYIPRPDPIAEVAARQFTPPPIISILIGEVAYNLKSALDYLVYELFYLATGKFEDGTKFPIETCKEGWERYSPPFDATPRKERKYWLHKLRGRHQTMLKGYQPFMGAEWTLVLSNMNNFDKHRSLIDTRGITTSKRLEKLSEARAKAMPPNSPSKCSCISNSPPM